MNILYNISIYLMKWGISAAGLFNPKARQWSSGRRDIFKKLSSAIAPGSEIAWFHAASLGEFEQGRPVIEAFRAKHPDYKILVTFFSPSGYEIRKNYSGADYIFYLPADTRRNVKRFLDIVNPRVAVFIKYEFWANYLKELRKRGVKTIVISAIFRENSSFFKWYGGRYRQLLHLFDHIFVQDENSRKLLEAVHVNNVTVAGDTRFDRVAEIVENAKNLPVVERFAAGAEVFIAGSTWRPDEDILLQLINSSPQTKFIIAPHEIDSDRIEKFRESTTRKSLRYTQIIDSDDVESAEILFIDTIGILSSVYRYGKYGYIGGGFGVGIHNILEAATFGLPLTFGPNYQKFKEARDLVALSGAVSVNNFEELEQWFHLVRDNSVEYSLAAGRCRDYVQQGRGATALIMSVL